MKKIEYYNPESNFSKSHIGRSPNWILKSGMSITAGVITILLLSSVFVKYPDKISSKITLSTEVPPVRVSSKASGIVEKIFVNEGEKVRKGQVLYYINDGYTSLNDVKELKKFIKKPLDTLINNSFKTNFLFLGDIQTSYQDFHALIIEYLEYLSYNPDMLQVSKLESSLKEYKRLKNIILRKINLQKKKLKLAEKQRDRARTLNDKGVISDKDKEVEEMIFYEKEEKLEVLLYEKSNINIKIIELNKRVEELNIKSENFILSFKENINNKLMSLKNKINEWERKHLIISPKEGVISFLKYDVLNNFVEENTTIMAVIPNNRENYVIKGKMYIQIYNSGKVNEGDIVNIYLDNYPYQDYGFIEGKVQNISEIPENKKGYLLNVELPNGLMSSQKKALPFKDVLNGSAEVILENKSLFKRFFNNIFYTEKNNKDYFSG
ncbi:HlyD family secretion protein [Tenacibaculum sp. A30]|uniref:HlyD family secretion protein n=1 Tax=Tenacibaculum sp. A30 TaxID=3442644 RepID=UPI003EB71A42